LVSITAFLSFYEAHSRVKRIEMLRVMNTSGGNTALTSGLQRGDFIRKKKNNHC